MRRHLNRVATAAIGLAVLISGSSARAADCEEIVGRHMVGEALLAAHFVAIAEKAGMSAAEINAILKQVAEKSAIEEFWISDPSGRAYLNNSGIDFTFDPDPAKQPQASQFWPLIKGEKGIVIQETRKREIDDRIFKYVGVAGVDKSRIVQVGASAANLPTCK